MARAQDWLPRRVTDTDTDVLYGLMCLLAEVMIGKRLVVKRETLSKGEEGTRMNCPVCTEVTLVLAERQGIEIDYCPQCRGVWLDRGELDKLIERGAPARAPSESQRSHPQARGSGERRAYGYDNDDDDYSHRGKRKKRGFLSELFDFD